MNPVFVFTLCICAPVLKPLVEVLSDPDSINRMLLSQLEQREQQAEQQKKAYTYAASYEDFIKLISTSTDVNFLTQLRHGSNDTTHTSPLPHGLINVRTACTCTDFTQRHHAVLITLSQTC